MREELKSYLLNLQGLEFIYEKALFPELEYIFKHALTQEVAYNSLLQKRRKEIHERIGQAIEEIYVDRLEEFYGMLAYHYSKSENFEKAYQYNKRSGDRAVSMYSNFDAFQFYKEAVIILKNLPDNEERKREMIGLIMLMDTPMRLLGYPDECIQYLQEGEQASKELGDERGLATFYSIMGLYYTFRADFQKSVEYGENCYQEATKIQDIDLMAPAAMELVVSYYWSGDYEKVVDMAPAIIELLEKNNKQAETFGRAINIYTVLLGFYGSCLSSMGYIREGEALCERSLRNALEISHLASLTFAEVLYGLCFFFKGETKAAIEHLQNAIRYGEEGQSLSDLAVAYMLLGWIYNEIGELKAAREHTEFALNFFRERGVPALEVIALTVFGMIYFESGNLKSSENYFRKALVLSQDIHKFWGGYSQIWLGRVHSRKDIKESDRAEKQILEGMEVLESSNIRILFAQGYLFLGELYADLGQNEKALENLKKVEDECKDMGVDYWLGRTYGVYSDLYKKEGDHSKAKENLNKAIEILKECGADGWVKKYEKELAAIS
jgi:tetratricopeptide (TPR) repeat protein